MKQTRAVDSKASAQSVCHGVLRNDTKIPDAHLGYRKIFQIPVVD